MPNQGSKNPRVYSGSINEKLLNLQSLPMDESTVYGLSEEEITVIIQALERDFIYIRSLRGMTIAGKRRMRKMRSVLIQKLRESV
jgi:hypothetical protein